MYNILYAIEKKVQRFPKERDTNNRPEEKKGNE